jgi:hypothetical protein
MLLDPYTQYAMSKLDNADYKKQVMQDVSNKAKQFFASNMNNINDMEALSKANA